LRSFYQTLVTNVILIGAATFVHRSGSALNANLLLRCWVINGLLGSGPTRERAFIWP